MKKVFNKDGRKDDFLMRRKFKRLTAFLLSAAMCISMLLNFPSSTFNINWDISVSAADNLTATIDTGASVTLKDGDDDNYYDIGTADELYTFAAIVNGGNNTINAELTKNITVNDGDLSTYNGTDSVSWRQWTPIGNYNVRYFGTFEGNNKTVSGLYFNDSEADEVGLFGMISKNVYTEQTAAVRNVGVINSYFNASSQTGAVCGWNHYGTVENCYNTSTVKGQKGHANVAGICGLNSDYATIRHCYNTGNISGGTYIGGVCGQNVYHSVIVNCYNTGKVTGYFAPGGVCGYNVEYSKVENCYNIGMIEEFYGTLYTTYVVGESYISTESNLYWIEYEGNGGKTESQFKSGEVCYLLNGSTSEGELVWGQTIGTDNSPVFGGKTVYSGYKSCSDTGLSYSNSADQLLETKPVHDFDDNNVCKNCGYELGRTGTKE